MAEMSGAIVCDTGAIPPGERAAHALLARRLFGARLGERVRHDRAGEGYQVEFAGEAFDDLVRWLANERRCCAFLHFTLDLPVDGPVRLGMIGPEGTRTFIEAQMFGMAPKETT